MSCENCAALAAEVERLRDEARQELIFAHDLRVKAEQRAAALEGALRDLLDSGVEVMDEHDTVEVFVSLLAWDCARTALTRPAPRPEGTR